MSTRDALLLIGHGSTNLPDAARPLLDHAEVIRASHHFVEVAVGTLLGHPSTADAVASLTANVVHVVPFFLEDGYFTRIAIPDLVLRHVSPSRIFRFCPPIGVHDGIAALIEARVAGYCETFDIDPKLLSVLLIGHGSAQSPGRARALRRHAATLESGGRFGWIRVAFLEEEPFAAEMLASTRGHVVAVVGFLVNEGMHATIDLPRLVAEERAQRGTNWPPVHDLGSIGTDASMPRLIMDQAASGQPA